MPSGLKIKLIRSIWFITVVSLLMLSAGVSHAQDAIPASELPLLEAGLHLGTTFYGSSQIPEETTLPNLLADASAHGMNAFTFYEDWSTLEPEAGNYQLDDLEATLIWLEGLGFTPLLNLTLIDIDALNLPTDLTEVPFDDPQLVERLYALLDEVVPLLVEHGGFVLLIGNEVDQYFADVNPNALESYSHLLEMAREHVRQIEPQLAVGVTLTGDEVLAQGEKFEALHQVTDVIPFNFYPLTAEFTVMPLEDIPAALNAYLDVYGDRPVIIQELGCPSGDALESSLDYQQQCFEVLFETLRLYPQVRFVTVFTLHDWDAQTCESVMDFLGLSDEELPALYMDRIHDYLCTLGLLDADFAPKPAWDVFLNALGD